LAGVDFAAARVVRAVVDLVAAVRLAAERVVAVASAMVASSGMGSGGAVLDGLWVDLGLFARLNVCERWGVASALWRGGDGHGLLPVLGASSASHCSLSSATSASARELVARWLVLASLVRLTRSHRVGRETHIGICLDPAVPQAPVVVSTSGCAHH